MLDFKIYFLLFIIYAISGWCLEVTVKLIESKKFVNRGFLIGPYCPIYGYGALSITFLLKKHTDDPLTLFIMAILICGILEYLTSYLMEKIFKARWWDYSQTKFNINGRVCLDTIIIFGLLGLFIIYISNPFLLGKIELLPQKWLNILFYSALVIYIVDNIISLFVIGYIRKAEEIVYKQLDNTEEITKKIKQILTERSILHRRLVNAYPKLEAARAKIKEKKEEIVAQLEEQKRELEKRLQEQSEKIEELVKNIKDFKNNK